MGLSNAKEIDPRDNAIEPLYHIDWTTGEEKEEFKVYKSRFYMLAVFSMASILQVILWNTWAPITETVFNVLEWTQSDIALLSMWGGIITVICGIPFAGLMDRFGLRTTFLLALTFSVVGAAIRCIPVPPEYLKWTANFGQLFIALGGPFIVQGPPLLSAAWFPPYQRATATAVASTSMIFGIAVSFLIGPWMVSNARPQHYPAGDKNETNFLLEATPTLSPEIIKTSIYEINRMLYIEFALIVILFIAALIYFPAVPPSPPSKSATSPREDFVAGTKVLIRSFNNFWIPSVAYGVSIGISGTWATQLVLMFHTTVGISQDTVSWIAFYTYLGGTIGAFVTSRVVDLIGGKMKLVLLCLTVPAIFVFVWFILLVYQIIPFSYVSLYGTTVTFGLLFKSTRPIYLELTCEGSYPVGEGITTGALNWMSNFLGLVYLGLMAIPNIGVIWMNWLVLGSIVTSFILLVIFKEENKRLDLDTEIDPLF